MKKNNYKFKTIIIIILLIILTSGISVYATSTVCKYLSTDVKYTKNGAEMSVKDALDELYVDTGLKTKVYYLGTIEGTKTDRSIDLSEILPNDYKNLTADNFVTEITNNLSIELSKPGQYITTDFSKINKTYNANTGELTITGGKLTLKHYSSKGGTLYQTKNQTLDVNVYAIIGNIQ